MAHRRITDAVRLQGGSRLLAELRAYPRHDSILARLKLYLFKSCRRSRAFKCGLPDCYTLFTQG